MSTERGEIDPSWFSQRTADLIIVLHGESENSGFDEASLERAQMLIQSTNATCGAYRWSRDPDVATTFLAIDRMEDV